MCRSSLMPYLQGSAFSQGKNCPVCMSFIFHLELFSSAAGFTGFVSATLCMTPANRVPCLCHVFSWVCVWKKIKSIRDMKDLKNQLQFSPGLLCSEKLCWCSTGVTSGVSSDSDDFAVTWQKTETEELKLGTVSKVHAHGTRELLTFL